MLRRAWAWARRRGYVSAELPTVRTRRTPTRIKLVGRPDEALAILEHLSGWHEVAFRVVLATGARPGEVCALNRASIAELDQGWLLLRGKTGPRAVPLDPHGPAARGLRRELAARGRLAPATGGQALRKSWARAVRRAGVREGLTLYAWRRAVARALRVAGVDLDERAAFLGHGVDVHSTVYDRVEREDVARAIRRAGLEELPEGRVLEMARKKDVRGY